MDTTQQKPLMNKWLAAGIVMIGIFIALLDATIVEIVLPKMMSSMNTDTYGVQWVVISYLTAAAIAMTSVEWLGAKIGHRNTYLAGLVIFTFFSILCGQATSIGFMNFSRFMQGLGEGIIVPIGMTILCEVFPDEERGTALGVYGLGASCAPALGPTLGGIITEHLSWRWIFYVNVPIGIIGIFLTIVLLRETSPEHDKPRSFDLPGFLTMAIAFGSLITFLSKGQEKGWLQSDYILALIAVFLISFPLFIVIQLKRKEPLFDLRVFRYRDFTLSFICMFVFSMSIYGIFLLIPMYLERFRQFTTLTSGLTMLPGSILAGFGVLAAGILSDKYSPKKLFLTSAVLMLIACWNLSTIDLYTERSTVIWYWLFWNIPMAFCFPPIQQIGFNEVPREKLNLVSCAQNVSRLLAGSIGTAFAITIMERRADSYFEAFGKYLNYGNVAAMNALRGLSGYLYSQGTPQLLIEKKGLKMLELFTTAKAYSYAIQSGIMWLGLLVIAVIILGLFVREPNRKNGAPKVPIH